jgi:hypothetical protein
MRRRIERQTQSGAWLLIGIVLFCKISLGQDVEDALSLKHYLITNDNRSTNTATFFQIRGTQPPTIINKVATGGAASQSYLGESPAKTVSVANVSGSECAYIANNTSANITGISIPNQKYVGIYSASNTDTGLLSMVSNGTYLYASYYTSKTIATFQMNAGCSLSFVGDAAASGLANGYVLGMALHGAMLVVTYSDGSIGSFNISAGVPVTNGDREYTAGHASSLRPYGVDISKNGEWAIFADCCSVPTVEVANISTGSLAPPVLYQGLGTATAYSFNVLVSPSGDLLYLADWATAEMTAAKFDEKNGKVSLGCVSSPLKDSYLGGLAMYSTLGTGSVVYVAQAYDVIGIVSVTPGVSGCTLSQPSNSPFDDANAVNLQSIAVYPPRPF